MRNSEQHLLEHQKRKRRGYILMLTLVLLSVMGTLAVSYIVVSTRDYEVAKKEEWTIQTFYLARCGLEYYVVNQADMPAGTKRRIEIEGSTGTQYCEIEVKTTDVYSTGIIATESGETLWSRTLIAPDGDIYRWHEVRQ